MTKSKLKFIKGFIFFVIAMIGIDFIVSKFFKTKFSIRKNNGCIINGVDRRNFYQYHFLI